MTSVEHLMDALEGSAREVQRLSNRDSKAARQARQKLVDARKALLAYIEDKDEEIAALRLMSDYDND